jgi:Cu+-exporting ATPase
LAVQRRNGRRHRGPIDPRTIRATPVASSSSPTRPPAEPIDILQPFLAAAGHVVVMRADGTTFAHEHAEVEDSSGRPVFAMSGTTFGPELKVHVQFDTAGTYQLWAQFRTADGDVLTVPFTVDAR